MNASILIIVGILIYAGFLIFHGLISFKSTSKSSEAFFTADRGVNPFVLLATTAISVFSALAFYGVPAAIYREGIGYFSNTGGMIAGLLFVILGYRLWILGKEYGFSTPVDYLRARYYSEGFGLLVAVVLILFIIPYVAMQLIAIGDAAVVTTKGLVPYVLAVALATVVVSLHIIGGGMKSVAGMDTFHFILGIGTLITLITYFTLTYFPDGGLAQAVDIIKNDPNLAGILSHPGPNGTFNWKGTLSNALTGAVATVVWPHIFMRTFIAASKDNFRTMSWSLPIAYVVIYFFIVVIGAIIAPAIVGPNFADTDNIMSVLSTEYAPPFISFISLLCLFAFGVSTADSMLLSASAIGSRDIYLRHAYELKGKQIDSKRVVYFGRILLVILMFLTIIVVAIKPAYIVDYAYKLSSPFFAQILPATIFGLFWKRGTKEGAIVGTVAGLIVTTIFTFFITPPLGFSALVWALLVNTVAFVGVSLVTKVPVEVVNKYIIRIDSIINSGTEINSAVDASISELNQKENL
ncbi:MULTISPECIES: sodium:solute symporter family protein [Bacillaceae]|uniref:Sodium:solute symporter family protein n=1 Tax=Niallia hominis TaxID=3133173 RepID=A0ABV1F0S9_9BACI|nr:MULTISPECIES: sodium:solute symporter family protein [Bacillaceae]MCF2647082.1 sodium:solute symporter family protein [Niallia circulans]CAI9392967.1 putative symporter YodF [Bacillus sp. T2.9-1]